MTYGSSPGGPESVSGDGVCVCGGGSLSLYQHPRALGPLSAPLPPQVCPGLLCLPGAAGFCPSGAWEHLGWGHRRGFPAHLTFPTWHGSHLAPVVLTLPPWELAQGLRSGDHRTVQYAGETKGENSWARRLWVTWSPFLPPARSVAPAIKLRNRMLVFRKLSR